MLNLYYYELVGKIEEYFGKKYLALDDNNLEKVLDKIKKLIGIEKIDNTKILIYTNHKLPDDIALKMLMTLINLEKC